MQKHNKKQFHHRHHIRVSMAAIVVAVALHVSGLAHEGEREKRAVSPANFAWMLQTHMERENETARHMIRFDEGLRPQSMSGGGI
jgi:hypothetical protein